MNTKKIFIGLFAILYLCVGIVSTIHAFSFFSLANTPILGAILAGTFEIGQAAVLFNLLTSPSQRKKFMPWALMVILTIVQVLGNIFSSYKYLITNSTTDLRFFKEPIFTWTELPDQQCNVIITYIVGAILPIVALCLTEMVVSYLHTDAEKQKEEEALEKDVENLLGTSDELSKAQELISLQAKELETLKGLINNDLNKPLPYEAQKMINPVTPTPEEELNKAKDDLLEESIEETIEEVADEVSNDFANDIIINAAKDELLEESIEETIEEVADEVFEEIINEPEEKETKDLMVDVPVPEVHKSSKSRFINI